MAISIKQIPVLKGSTALSFVCKTYSNVKNTKSVDFKKEIKSARNILMNTKL